MDWDDIRGFVMIGLFFAVIMMISSGGCSISVNDKVYNLKFGPASTNTTPEKP